MKKKNEVLPIIVIAQFCCTSLWFAGNAVLKELMQHFNLGTSALEDLTSAVQFGFITGTLLFAIFTIVDRFSPSKVFFLCAFLLSYQLFVAKSNWLGRFYLTFFVCLIPLSWTVGWQVVSLKNPLYGTITWKIQDLDWAVFHWKILSISLVICY